MWRGHDEIWHAHGRANAGRLPRPRRRGVPVHRSSIACPLSVVATGFDHAERTQRCRYPPLVLFMRAQTRHAAARCRARQNADWGTRRHRRRRSQPASRCHPSLAVCGARMGLRRRPACKLPAGETLTAVSSPSCRAQSRHRTPWVRAQVRGRLHLRNPFASGCGFWPRRFSMHMLGGGGCASVQRQPPCMSRALVWERVRPGA